MPPFPEKVYEEVVSWSWVGNQNTSLQVFPASTVQVRGAGLGGGGGGGQPEKQPSAFRVIFPQLVPPGWV